MSRTRQSVAVARNVLKVTGDAQAETASGFRSLQHLVRHACREIEAVQR
jgi:hypothetical protein